MLVGVGTALLFWTALQQQLARELPCMVDIFFVCSSSCCGCSPCAGLHTCRATHHKMDSQQQQLVQRRAGGGSGSTRSAPPPLWRSFSHAAPDGAPSRGLPAWQLWTLFGIGWPSILFFGLSSLPFGASARWWLIVWGWIACGAWLAAVAAGLSIPRPCRAQAQALNANLIMAVIGSALGTIFLATYIWQHAPSLYAWALLLLLGLMWGAKTVLDQPQQEQAHEPAAPSVADALLLGAGGDGGRSAGAGGDVVSGNGAAAGASMS